MLQIPTANIDATSTGTSSYCDGVISSIVVTASAVPLFGVMNGNVADGAAQSPTNHETILDIIHPQ